MQQKGKVTRFHFPTQILEMAVMDRAFVESGKAKVRKDEARQSKAAGLGQVRASRRERTSC